MGKKLQVKDYTDAKVQADLKDADMFKSIKEGVTADGKERMKAFKDDLTDAEITDLVAYIRHMKVPAGRPRRRTHKSRPTDARTSVLSRPSA